MNAEQLRGLADQCEQATGPDRLLAKAIFRIIHPELVPDLGHPNGYGWREDDTGWWLATGEDQRCPPKRIDPPKWLTSLDGAMSLVPEGWGREIWDADNGDALCSLWQEPAAEPQVYVRAKTWPLVVTAAALRALAHKDQDQ